MPRPTSPAKTRPGAAPARVGGPASRGAAAYRSRAGATRRRRGPGAVSRKYSGVLTLSGTSGAIDAAVRRVRGSRSTPCGGRDGTEPEQSPVRRPRTGRAPAKSAGKQRVEARPARSSTSRRRWRRAVGGIGAELVALGVRDAFPGIREYISDTDSRTPITAADRASAPAAVPPRTTAGSPAARSTVNLSVSPMKRR